LFIQCAPSQTNVRLWSRAALFSANDVTEVTKRSLRLQKDCGARDTSKCQFCDARYPTFPGVRQHKRLAHPEQESEAKLSEAESTLLENIALVEAKSIKAVGFYKDMVAATGLNQNQIRYRREKPVYKF
jgi:hypothetical protein